MSEQEQQQEYQENVDINNNNNYDNNNNEQMEENYDQNQQQQQNNFEESPERHMLQKNSFIPEENNNYNSNSEQQRNMSPNYQKFMHLQPTEEEDQQQLDQNTFPENHEEIATKKNNIMNIFENKQASPLKQKIKDLKIKEPRKQNASFNLDNMINKPVTGVSTLSKVLLKCQNLNELATQYNQTQVNAKFEDWGLKIQKTLGSAKRENHTNNENYNPLNPENIRKFSPVRNPSPKKHQDIEATIQDQFQKTTNNNINISSIENTNILSNNNLFQQQQLFATPGSQKGLLGSPDQKQRENRLQNSNFSRNNYNNNSNIQAVQSPSFIERSHGKACKSIDPSQSYFEQSSHKHFQQNNEQQLQGNQNMSLVNSAQKLNQSSFRNNNQSYIQNSNIKINNTQNKINSTSVSKETDSKIKQYFQQEKKPADSMNAIIRKTEPEENLDYISLPLTYDLNIQRVQDPLRSSGQNQTKKNQNITDQKGLIDVSNKQGKDKQIGQFKNYMTQIWTNNNSNPPFPAPQQIQQQQQKDSEGKSAQGYLSKEQRKRTEQEKKIFESFGLKNNEENSNLLQNLNSTTAKNNQSQALQKRQQQRGQSSQKTQSISHLTSLDLTHIYQDKLKQRKQENENSDENSNNTFQSKINERKDHFKFGKNNPIQNENSIIQNLSHALPTSSSGSKKNPKNNNNNVTQKDIDSALERITSPQRKYSLASKSNNNNNTNKVSYVDGNKNNKNDFQNSYGTPKTSTLLKNNNNNDNSNKQLHSYLNRSSTNTSQSSTSQYVLKNSNNNKNNTVKKSYIPVKSLNLFEQGYEKNIRDSQNQQQDSYIKESYNSRTQSPNRVQFASGFLCQTGNLKKYELNINDCRNKSYQNSQNLLNKTEE